MLRKAFTLMEVNLAILVMAGGILSSVALFSLGYRQSMESNEDVASAAYAEEVIGPLVLALSDKNMKWSDFKQIQDTPVGLWLAYFDKDTGEVKSGSLSQSSSAFKQVMDHRADKKISAQIPTPPDSLDGVGLVITHEQNSPVVKIAFRTTRKERLLMSAPLYFTEVVFQGTQE